MEREDLLLDRAFRDQSVDGDGARLSNAMRPVSLLAEADRQSKWQLFTEPET
jgi:hypothetical protein